MVLLYEFQLFICNSFSFLFILNTLLFKVISTRKKLFFEIVNKKLSYMLKYYDSFQ